MDACAVFEGERTEYGIEFGGIGHQRSAFAKIGGAVNILLFNKYVMRFGAVCVIIKSGFQIYGELFIRHCGHMFAPAIHNFCFGIQIRRFVGNRVHNDSDAGIDIGFCAGCCLQHRARDINGHVRIVIIVFFWRIKQMIAGKIGQALAAPGVIRK